MAGMRKIDLPKEYRSAGKGCRHSERINPSKWWDAPYWKAWEERQNVTTTEAKHEDD